MPFSLYARREGVKDAKKAIFLRVITGNDWKYSTFWVCLTAKIPPASKVLWIIDFLTHYDRKKLTFWLCMTVLKILTHKGPLSRQKQPLSRSYFVFFHPLSYVPFFGASIYSRYLRTKSRFVGRSKISLKIGFWSIMANCVAQTNF